MAATFVGIYKQGLYYLLNCFHYRLDQILHPTLVPFTAASIIGLFLFMTLPLFATRWEGRSFGRRGSKDKMQAAADAKGAGGDEDAEGGVQSFRLRRQWQCKQVRITVQK